MTLLTCLSRTKILLALATSSVALHGADISDFKGNGEPLHPSAVTTTIDGKAVPVIGVVGQKAQIEANGKSAEAPSNAGYGFVRMPSFGPGLVTIKNQVHQKMQDEIRSDNGMVIADIPNNWASSEYHARLTSDTAFDGAFAVIVVFDREFLNGGPVTAPGVYFKEIGALGANQTRELVVNVGKYADAVRDRLMMFPLIFVGGREIRTNLAELSAAYFRRLELSRHGNIVSNYVKKNEGADKGLQPYVRVAPIFSAADRAGGTLPPKVNVRLAVGEDGIVSQADAQGELPAGVKTELERAMRGWLFLPQLKAGQPTAIKAAVPITIGSSQ